MIKLSDSSGGANFTDYMNANDPFSIIVRDFFFSINFGGVSCCFFLFVRAHHPELYMT